LLELHVLFDEELFFEFNHGSLVSEKLPLLPLEEDESILPEEAESPAAFEDESLIQVPGKSLEALFIPCDPYTTLTPESIAFPKPVFLSISELLHLSRLVFRLEVMLELSER